MLDVHSYLNDAKMWWSQNHTSFFFEARDVCFQKAASHALVRTWIALLFRGQCQVGSRRQDVIIAERV